MREARSGESAGTLSGWVFRAALREGREERELLALLWYGVVWFSAVWEKGLAYRL